MVRQNFYNGQKVCLKFSTSDQGFCAVLLLILEEARCTLILSKKKQKPTTGTLLLKTAERSLKIFLVLNNHRPLQSMKTLKIFKIRHLWFGDIKKSTIIGMEGQNKPSQKSKCYTLFFSIFVIWSITTVNHNSTLCPFELFTWKNPSNYSNYNKSWS